MFICVCTKCKYLDLIEENETLKKCIRCGSDSKSLGVQSGDWYSMDIEAQKIAIEKAVAEDFKNNKSVDISTKIEEIAELDQTVTAEIGLTDEKNIYSTCDERKFKLIENVESLGQSVEEATVVDSYPDVYENYTGPNAWERGNNCNKEGTPSEEGLEKSKTVNYATAPGLRKKVVGAGANPTAKVTTFEKSVNTNAKNVDLDKKKKDRLIYAIIAGVVIICMCLMFVMEGKDKKEHAHQLHAVMTNEDIANKDYSSVIEQFKAAGFTNITIEEIDDLVLGFLKKDGEVEKITINGSVEFTANEWFDPGVEIVVAYHTFPKSNEDIGTTDVADTGTVVTDKENNDSLYREEIEEIKEVTVDNNPRNAYAYVKKGPNYWLYYILDFDDNTARCFDTDGSGSIAEIVSGSLNDRLVLRFKEYDEIVHWHYVDNDAVLIVEDEPSAVEYMKTDIDTAEKYWDKCTSIY